MGTKEPEDDLGNDLIVGAEEIAAWLNSSGKGKWTRRRVYHLAEKGEIPLHKVKGLGICARKSALLAYFERLDEPYFAVFDLKSPS
jgi:hypothetical protein